MRYLIYLLPERLRRKFQFYRMRLYPLWFQIDFVSDRGKHWVPYYDLVEILKTRVDVLMYSTEIHDDLNRIISIDGDNQLFDNMDIKIPGVQDTIDRENLAKKENDEAKDNTDTVEEYGKEVSEHE